MGRNFRQGALSDMDCISAWLLSQDESGKTNEVEFERLIQIRRDQVGEELVRLREDVLPNISKKDFERMGRVYLISQEHQCSMREAEEYLTKLEQERDKRPEGDYAKIVESMKTPKSKYDITKLDEKPQREEPQVEHLPPTKFGVAPQKRDVTWITGSPDEELDWEKDGNIKLEKLRKKWR